MRCWPTSSWQTLGVDSRSEVKQYKILRSRLYTLISLVNNYSLAGAVTIPRVACNTQYRGLPITRFPSLIYYSRYRYYEGPWVFNWVKEMSMILAARATPAWSRPDYTVWCMGGGLEETRLVTCFLFLASLSPLSRWYPPNGWWARGTCLELPTTFIFELPETFWKNLRCLLLNFYAWKEDSISIFFTCNVSK